MSSGVREWHANRCLLLNAIGNHDEIRHENGNEKESTCVAIICTVLEGGHHDERSMSSGAGRQCASSPIVLSRAPN